MTFEDWLLWTVPRLLAYLVWVGLWWFVIGKFGYRRKTRIFWIIPFLVPPINPYLAPIGSTALILLIFLPYPVWREVRRLRKMFDDRPIVKPTHLIPGRIYYIRLPGNYWVEARYSGFTTVKGETKYRFVHNEKTAIVDNSNIRAT